MRFSTRYDMVSIAGVFRQFIAGEVGKWAKLVRISGAKVD